MGSLGTVSLLTSSRSYQRDEYPPPKIYERQKGAILERMGQDKSRAG